jgi:hypothetical protein
VAFAAAGQLAAVLTAVVLPTLVAQQVEAPQLVVQLLEPAAVKRLQAEADLHGGEVEALALVLVLALVRVRVLGPRVVELHPAARVRIMAALHLAVRDLRMAEHSKAVWASESKLLSITARKCIIFNTDFLDIDTNIRHHVKDDDYLVLCRNFIDSEFKLLNIVSLVSPN